MKRCLCTLLISSLALVVNAIAGDTVLPAGTLLQCTLNEPNFSTNTVLVGDPVLCHLRGLVEFGQPAFSRGSYLVGHLEAAKEPGHFVGKGYLELHFDRIGVPSGDMPLDAKIIAAGKYKVDRVGKIHGKGHAKRDAVEWMLPPLWPIKVVTLPARGPRPKIKGETVLTLRLMDDVAIPQIAQTFGPGISVPQVASTSDNSHPAIATKVPAPSLSAPIALKAEPSVLILHSGARYVTNAIRVDDNRVSYTLSDGTSGVVNLDDIDWTKTIQMNAENGAVLALSASSH
jgi:hypothetical protein